MQRAVLLSLAAVLLAFVAESSAQHIILPTYRPPPPPKHPPIYRVRRDADEPLWLNQGDDVIRAPATGDHPYLPPYIDDIHLDPNTRHARSVDSPSAKRGGGSHSTSSGSRDTGPTPPGYNRRNARDIRLPQVPSPLPKPYYNPSQPGPSGDVW